MQGTVEVPTTVVEEGINMNPKERLHEIIDSHIQRTQEELDEAHRRVGELRLDEDIEYKEFRKAELKCERLKGTKEAFELAQHLVFVELPDMDYVPKSVEHARLGHCNQCGKNGQCGHIKEVGLFNSKCPEGKW